MQFVFFVLAISLIMIFYGIIKQNKRFISFGAFTAVFAAALFLIYTFVYQGSL